MKEGNTTNRSRDMSKEERLAAKLRENLRRRKAQSRQMTGELGEPIEADLPKSERES